MIIMDLLQCCLRVLVVFRGRFLLLECVTRSPVTRVGLALQYTRSLLVSIASRQNKPDYYFTLYNILFESFLVLLSQPAARKVAVESKRCLSLTQLNFNLPPTRTLGFFRSAVLYLSVCMYTCDLAAVSTFPSPRNFRFERRRESNIVAAKLSRRPNEAAQKIANATLTPRLPRPPLLCTPRTPVPQDLLVPKVPQVLCTVQIVIYRR